MSSSGEQAPAYAEPAPSGPAYLSSLVALALGVVLAVGVSAVFGLVGWGGELASQTAGAASGAAPLLIDGVRQRRSRGTERLGPRARTARLLRRYNRVWVASAFGFALLLLNAVVGLLAARVTRWSIRLAEGDPARYRPVYTLIGSVIIWPTVIAGTYLLAVAAGHRLGERNRRWILLGVGIYAAVTLGMVVFGGAPPELGATPAVLATGLLLSTALMVWISLLGARRARSTQSAYYAQLYMRRLDPADQEAALALLDETVSDPPPATPPAAAPSTVAVPPAPRPPAPR